MAIVATFALATSVAHADVDRPDVALPPVLTLKVAAASDLAFAFAEIAKAYEAKYPFQKINVSMGSTGQFAKQLAEGAPFDVFAAANVSFVDDVVKAGVCDGTTKALYGQGRIVLWSNKALGLSAPADLKALTDKKYVKIAIANPEHAPYGKAAEEAMKKVGVYDAIKPKLVFGENIQQTMKYAQSGNVEVAVVALSLALATKDGDYKPIDPSLHNEINQAIVVCGKDAERAKAAKSFVSFVSSADGRAIMKRFGFVLPGET